MLQMQAKYCMQIIVPMMQLSQSVVWMRSSSWIIQRVLATDWAKQQNTSRARQHSGQLCSLHFPEQGQLPLQQMYLDISP